MTIHRCCFNSFSLLPPSGQKLELLQDEFFFIDDVFPKKKKKKSGDELEIEQPTPAISGHHSLV